MQDRGIDRSVLSVSSPILPVTRGASDPRLSVVEELNDFAADAAGRYPEHLSFVAALPLPDVAAATTELHRAMDCGALGAIIPTNVQGRYLDDPGLRPLWQALNSRNGLLLIHPTSPVGWQRTPYGLPAPALEFMFETTRSLAALLMSNVFDDYPHMRVVAPHAGGALGGVLDRFRSFLPVIAGGDAAIVDLWDQRIKRLWFDLAGAPFPHVVPTIADFVGADRFVYGSDSCWTPGPTIERQLSSIDAASAPDGHASWWSLLNTNARTLMSAQPR